MKYDNSGKVRFGWKRLDRMNSVWIWIALALIMLVAAGCVSKPNDMTKNETVTTPFATDTPLIADTPVATNITPSTGQTGTVPPAPYQLYIKAGQIYQFTYGGIFHERRNFTVNYTSAHPTQIVKITFNGYEKTIQKEQTDKPNAIYWSEGGFGFTLKPVLWEIREGQRGPSYEVTWNTTELYFEVRESK